MKRSLHAACAAFSGLAMTSAGAAQAAELVYGSWVSPKHSVMRTAMPNYFANVAKATNGGITWKMVAGGQLVDVKSTVPGLKDGLIDGGFLIAPFVPSYVPALNLVFGTQVFGDDTVASTGAMMEFMLLKCPACAAEAKKIGIVELGGFSTTPYVLMCRVPVATVADMKGKKIRSIGGGVPTMALGGAVPVGMSPADATQALQRGGLDCVHGPASWLRSYGYQDVAKYVTDFPLGMSGPALHLSFSRKRFLALTPEQRKAHVMAAPESVAISAIDGYILNDREIIKGAKSKGVKFVKGGKDFEGLVAKRDAQQRQANIETAKKFNVPEPGKILDTFNEALKKWQKLSPDIGLDKGKFSEALRREVYSKVDPEKL
ncbi:MAG: TRAP transporter substrate-binding protein DctP [Hyphomicrobiaceae bacterium]